MTREFNINSIPSAQGENPTPAANLPGSLPPWSAALPLWSATRWLWLTLQASGQLHLWQSAPGQSLHVGHATSISDLPQLHTLSLVILDCRRVTSLSPEFCATLADLLAPGGLLLVCCRDKRLPDTLLAHAPDLRSSGWHVIEPGQEDTWHLRPATPRMRAVTHDLDPPYSTREWLRRRLPRWLHSRRNIYCLPVWKVAGE